MAHSIVEVYVHIVFSTKNRQRFIDPGIEKRLHPYLAGIARKKKVITLAVNGTEDHAHMLQKLHAKVAIAKLVGDMKSLSSGKMKDWGYHDFTWQEGYGAFSCSKNHVEAVQRYIQNQKEHHREQTYDDEMKRYGDKWGFVWARRQVEDNPRIDW